MTIKYLSISMLLTSTLFANTLDFNYQQSQLDNSLNNSVVEGAFIQPIDHDNNNQGTFIQRYYIDESFSTGNNAPVFFYICGEGPCTPGSLSGAIRNHAQKFGAKLISLEHRYYGNSLPMPTFSTNDLRFLSTEQALEDLAYFQQSISKQLGWTGSWVAFGGSYPGSLSAFYRLKYPTNVIGSLASSAPVKAKEDYFEYDRHVAKVTGESCLRMIQKAVATLDSSIDNPQKLYAFKEMFRAQNIENNIDFLYLVADIGAFAVQYGQHEEFCTMLKQAKTPIDGYAQMAQKIYDTYQMDPVSMTFQGAMSEDPADYQDGFGMRPWLYQSCTEYGYWQNANPKRKLSARSALIDLPYHREACLRLFGINTPVNTERTNNKYYNRLFDTHVSNIFFTNGADDPWSVLSMTKKNGNNTNKKLKYETIKGAAHCADLHSPRAQDSKALLHARSQLQNLLKHWLVQYS